LNEKLSSHPNLVSWAVLAVGMLIVLAISARDQGLNAGQWFWLAAATALLAGLCAWIIGWEADDDLDEADAIDPQAAAPAAGESASPQPGGRP
jgi:hypothetical protein